MLKTKITILHKLICQKEIMLTMEKFNCKCKILTRNLETPMIKGLIFEFENNLVLFQIILTNLNFL